MSVFTGVAVLGLQMTELRVLRSRLSSWTVTGRKLCNRGHQARAAFLRFVASVDFRPNVRVVLRRKVVV